MEAASEVIGVIVQRERSWGGLWISRDEIFAEERELLEKRGNKLILLKRRTVNLDTFSGYKVSKFNLWMQDSV